MNDLFNTFVIDTRICQFENLFEYHFKTHSAKHNFTMQTLARENKIFINSARWVYKEGCGITSRVEASGRTPLPFVKILAVFLCCALLQLACFEGA